MKRQPVKQEFAIRTRVPAIPQYIVTWAWPCGQGEDIAWFFVKKDAEEYLGSVQPKGKGKTACSPK